MLLCEIDKRWVAATEKIAVLFGNGPHAVHRSVSLVHGVDHRCVLFIRRVILRKPREEVPPFPWRVPRKGVDVGVRAKPRVRNPGYGLPERHQRNVYGVHQLVDGSTMTSHFRSRPVPGDVFNLVLASLPAVLA